MHIQERERREKMNEHIEVAKKYLADDKLFTQEELDLNVLSANDDFDFWHARYVSDMLSYRKVELFQKEVMYDVWKDIPTDTALDFSSTSWAALSEARIAKAAAQGVAFACAEKTRLICHSRVHLGMGTPLAQNHYKRWKKCRTFVNDQIEKYEELST